MRRRFPVLGAVLILVGVAGLASLSVFQGGLWGDASWPMGPWGAGSMLIGPGMIRGMGPGMMGGWSWGWSGKQTFGSNGERIYFTGVSAKTGPIPASAGPMWVGMRGGGCVACHGVQGRGGVPVMMGGALPSDIRYEALTKEEHREGEKAREHPPYTDDLIKRAITRGVDPAGNSLDWTMPRWRMGDADFADLLAYLKTLR
ncbi:MAG: cytochrome c [candidate division NC10 bacterium]|nr:cytochrome c [candidate division NC10 bacterium]